jgi:hypothetical protein
LVVALLLNTVELVAAVAEDRNDRRAAIFLKAVPEEKRNANADADADANDDDNTDE